MNELNQGKCVIFSAPSGAGKTTIVHAMLKRRSDLAFSVSACSRPPRANETNGVDYHFLSVEEFKSQIENNAFIEWEEVYENMYYGTLKSAVEDLWKQGKVVVFDVDVIGGLNLKSIFGKQALAIFVEPPSVETLEERLRRRQTESEEKLQLRLSKAKEELAKKDGFDVVILNEDLNTAIEETEYVIDQFIAEK